MSIMLTIFVILAVFSVLNSLVNSQRQIAFNRINNIYDKMELFALQNNMKIDASMASFLAQHKVFKVNNEFADIHVLLAILQNMPEDEFKKNKAEYERIFNALPDGMKSLAKDFGKEVDKAIVLSIFRVEFITFFIYLLFKSLFKSLFEMSSNSITSLMNKIKDLFVYESVIASHTSRLAY